MLKSNMMSNMKPGDTVWVFQVSPQEIVEGTCVDVLRVKRKTYVTIGYATPSGAIIRSGGNILGKDCFPTREALCEHYKKIFE